MMRFKRVPTVVSNYQSEVAEGGAQRGVGCGRNCLRDCCTPGAKLPLYAYRRVNKIDNEKHLVAHDSRKPPVVFLDSLLLGEWEE